MKASIESVALDGGTNVARSSGRGVKRVLLAWDDPLAREVLGEKLRSVGFEVEEAGDATVALKKLHSTHPHAVFLQFSLQGSQGVEFVKEARRDTKFAERPIYVCTVCSSLSTWTRRTANAGPTKFFNMLATPVEKIVASVMADVAAVDAPPNDSTAVEVVVPPITRNVSPALKKNVSDLIRDLKVATALHDEEMRVAKCVELRRRVHSVMSCGAVAGLLAMARLAAAVENLLKALCAAPKSITASSLHSIGVALQTLDELCAVSSLAEESQSSVLAAVVLADEARNRAAACNALIGAGFETNSFSEQLLALKHLATNRADFIALGWNPSEGQAAEIYAAIRALPMQEHTPVIAYSSSAEAGNLHPDAVPGAEVLEPPFSFAEVAVRSLALVYKFHLAHPPMVNPMNTTEPDLNKAPSMDNAEVNPAAESLIESPPQAQTEEIPMNTPEVLEEAPSTERTVKPAAAVDPVARCRQLEEELSGMGHLCGELLSKYTAEQQNAAEAAQRGIDLEKQLSERDLELSKANAELERLTIEGGRLGAENRSLQEAKEAAEKNIAAAEEAKASPDELAALQQRLDEAVAGRSRLSADLERERAERRRLEQRATSLAAQLQEMHSRTGQHLEAERLSQDRISALEKQMSEREDALARTTADLERELAEHHSAEEQLRAASDLIAQLKNSVSSFEGAKKAMQRRHDELEKQLQSRVSAATDNEARADKESRERERLEKALLAAERAAQQQTAELSRLQCALEVEQAERKQLEGEAVQLRYSSADSARSGLTTLNRLRSETRQPVSQLMHATRQLLERELPEDTKALITSVLDNALLLQDKLQEIGGSKSAPLSAEPRLKSVSASSPLTEQES